MTETYAESAKSRTKHQVVRDRLVADIRSGHYSPGDALPTELKLVETFGYSRQTIRQALATLEKDGMVERIQGSGTFVTTEQRRQSRQQMDCFAFIAPELQTGVYPWMLGGFQRVCADCGHQALVGNSRDNVGQQADLLMQMMDQKVGGVALVPTTSPPTPPHQIRLIQSCGIPIVFCHRTVEGTQAPGVLIDGKDIGLIAGRTFRDLGHRRIAFFFNHRYSMSDNYSRGLQSALSEAGHDPAGILEIEYETVPVNDRLDAERAIRFEFDKLLAGPQMPTAIFCGNPPTAEIIYLHAQAHGLRIPEDLSIICVGCTSRVHGLVGRLTMVAIDESELGAKAAQLLHEMRSGLRPIQSEEQFILPPTLVPGETIGPACRAPLT